MKTVIVSRVFDEECGSGEWMLAEKIYKQLDENTTKKIYQKHSSKIIHDWMIIPYLCIWYRILGYKKFIFMSENQATPVILLNLMLANTIVYFYDLMRIQNSNNKSIDHFYFSLIYYNATFAKNIIAISFMTANELLDKYGDKLKHKIAIIPPYVETFKPDYRFRRNNVIGYLGGLIERKRPLDLIRLAKYIKIKKLKYVVEVWGEGDMKEELEEKIIENGLSNIIFLKGHAPEKDKENIINSFGFFFFPTEKEGFGLPIYEAVSCAVPTFVFEDAVIPLEVKSEAISVKNFDDMFEKIKILEKI